MRVEKLLKKHQNALELARNAEDKEQQTKERKEILALEKKKVKKEDMLLKLEENVQNLEK